MTILSVFDSIMAMDKLKDLKFKRREKLSQIADVKSKRCGNCNHWMKSSYKPEKLQKQFKSCNSMACSDFVLGSSSNHLIPIFEKELADIDNKIQQFTESSFE